MKARYGSLALALLFVTGSAWADDDVEQREDPWEYDKAKSEKREKAEQEEKDSERTFGNSGEIAISAERLVGFSSTSRRIKLTGPDQKDKVTRVHLFLNQNGDPLGYSAARLAFDLFVMDGLSLGGALGYSSDADGATSREFLVAPRIGYALMFSELIGVWPRAGVTYQDQELSVGAASAKVAMLAGTVEAELVLVPTANVLITLGPSYDFSLVGKYNPDPGAKTDISQSEFGFSAGLGVFF